MRIKYLLNRQIAPVALMMFFAVSLFANDNVVKVEQLYPGKVDIQSFKLSEESNLTITGKGAKLKKRSRNILCYGWIIDVKTGKVKWNSIKLLKNKYKHDSGIFSFEDKISLPAGFYKAYYTAVYDTDGINIKDFGDLMETIFSNWDDEDVFTFNEDELQMIVKGPKGTFQKLEDFCYYLPNDQKEVVSFFRIGEDAYNEKSFTLRKPTKLYIQSSGEKKDRKFYDYGRIYDMQNHTVVWPTNHTVYEYAGGGWKNVKAQDEIELPKGTYTVSYVSDDSHSFNDWNVMPPNNPENWGIQVSCDEKDYNNIDFSVEKIEPVVDLMKAGNHAVLAKGIEVTRDLDVRVICLGEYSDGEAYDYGWIENATSNEIVWRFNGSNTVHAGGGSKNRKFNGIVHLDKGKYIVKYISDGSHSYFDWNTTPPFEKEYWGISVWTLKSDDQKYIKEINVQKLQNENVIVKIDRVGDHEKLQKDFTIEKDGLYRIYCIGEGDDDEMFDTGWIKNVNTGQVVWEMTWRNSRHAGGASKNRMFNGKIYMMKGNYRVYYETDGSHSFADWNSTPPRNPDKYGIRVLTE